MHVITEPVHTDLSGSTPNFLREQVALCASRFFANSMWLGSIGHDTHSSVVGYILMNSETSQGM